MFFFLFACLGNNFSSLPTIMGSRGAREPPMLPAAEFAPLFLRSVHLDPQRKK